MTRLAASGIELIVLGSGSFAPARNRRLVRNPAGYAVRVAGRLLLFDLGFGAMWQLARTGLAVSAVTDVFLTHRHPDHVGDLAALLFHLRYDEPPRRGLLRVWGPRGLRGFVARLRRSFSPWLEPRGYRLEARELKDGGAVRGPGWRVEALRALHPTPALSYRLTSRGGSLVLSGDTGPNPRLARFAAGCGALILEAALAPDEANPAHLNPRQAMALAQAAAPRRALFSHLSEASAAGLRRLLARTRGLRAGLARDLMRLRIERPRHVR